ncbi:hypothetical protein DFH28DRAFT_922613 [Melampsora americana]|nr:hypothetical protein DFH28DRAFT_922613 [Melampsora americana]
MCALCEKRYNYLYPVLKDSADLQHNEKKFMKHTIYRLNTNKQSQGRPKKSEKQARPKEPESDLEDKKSQASWFEKQSDGYSDMDLIALWCSDENNYNRWQDKIPSKRIVAGMIADYLNRLHNPHTEKFKDARTKSDKTGQGVLDCEDWVKELKGINTISVSLDSEGEQLITRQIYESVNGKKRNRKADDGASIIEHALSACPWYCILEPVMLTKPNVEPESTQDSLGNTSFSNLASDLNFNWSRNDLIVDDDPQDNDEDDNDNNNEEIDGISQEVQGSQLSQRPTKILPSKREQLSNTQRKYKKEKRQFKLNAQVANAITEMSANRKDNLQLKREQLRSATTNPSKDVDNDKSPDESDELSDED